MVRRRRARVARQRLAQRLLCLVLRAAAALQVGQVQSGLHEGRVQRQRAAVGCHRVVVASPRRIEVAEVGAPLGPVGVERSAAMYSSSALAKRLSRRRRRRASGSPTRARAASMRTWRTGSSSRRGSSCARDRGVGVRKAAAAAARTRASGSPARAQRRQRRRAQLQAQPPDRAGAHDRRLLAVLGDAGQRAAALAAARSAAQRPRRRSGSPRVGRGNQAFTACGRPLRRCCPRGSRCRRSACRGSPSGRGAECASVVVARVDHHVGRRRHVAGRRTGRPSSRAHGGGAPASSNFAAQMALAADGVAGRAQLQRMRVVAVGAGHALRVHPALQERAVVVDLVAHLAVGVVEAGSSSEARKPSPKRLAGVPCVGDLAAARVAARAGLDLARAVARRRAHRVARRGIDRPSPRPGARRARPSGPCRRCQLAGRRRPASPRRRGRSRARGRPRRRR